MKRVVVGSALLVFASAYGRPASAQIATMSAVRLAWASPGRGACVGYADGTVGYGTWTAGQGSSTDVRVQWRSDEPMTDIACSDGFCTLARDGTVLCHPGGEPERVSLALRVPGADRLFAMPRGVCALDPAGDAYCNSSGLDQAERAVSALRALGPIRSLVDGTYCAFIEGHRFACALPSGRLDASFTDVVAASASWNGAGHSACAALTDGTVHCTRVEGTAPSGELPGFDHVRDLELGPAHVCALREVNGQRTVSCIGRYLEFAPAQAPAVCAVDTAATARARAAFQRGCPRTTSPDRVCERMRWQVEPPVIYRHDGHCVDPLERERATTTSPITVSRTIHAQPSRYTITGCHGTADALACSEGASQWNITREPGAASRQPVRIVPPPSAATGLRSDAVCHDGWCWQDGTLLDGYVADVAAPVDALDDEWIRTSFDRLAHRVGGRWRDESPFATGTISDSRADTRVRGLAVATRDDVWAWGMSSVAHWDGRAWTVMGGTGAPRAVFAMPGGEAWIAGWMSASDLAHWSGHRLQFVDVPDSGGFAIDSIWGARPDDVWFAETRSDSHSGLLHWNGRALQRVEAPMRGGITLRGTGPDDVWATTRGVAPNVWQYDGHTWTALPGLGAGTVFQAMVGTPRRNEAWTRVLRDRAGYRRIRRTQSGFTVEPMNVPHEVASVVASGAALVALGPHGERSRLDGAQWNAISTNPVIDPGRRVHALWARNEHDVLAVGDYTDPALEASAIARSRAGLPGIEVHRGLAMRSDGTRWQVVQRNMLCSLQQIAASPDGSTVLAAGRVLTPDGTNRRCAMRWNGTQWIDDPLHDASDRADGLGFDADGTPWRMERTGPSRWTGGQWQAVDGWPANTFPTRIRPMGPHETWVVGASQSNAQTYLARWDGHRLQPLGGADPAQGIGGIVVGDARDAWVGGTSWVRLTNGRWQPDPRTDVSRTVDRDLFVGAYAAASDDIWAVTSMGRAWHWDGATWRPTAVLPTGGHITAFTGAGHHVWAASDEGGVLHFGW